MGNITKKLRKKFIKVKKKFPNAYAAMVPISTHFYIRGKAKKPLFKIDGCIIFSEIMMPEGLVYFFTKEEFDRLHKR